MGGGGGAGVGGGAEKTAFSFKKCSAFQFVKRKVSLEDSCLDGGVTDGVRSLSVLVCLLAKDDVIFSSQDAARSVRESTACVTSPCPVI